MKSFPNINIINTYEYILNSFILYNCFISFYIASLRLFTDTYINFSSLYLNIYIFFDEDINPNYIKSASIPYIYIFLSLLSLFFFISSYILCSASSSSYSTVLNFFFKYFTKFFINVVPGDITLLLNITSSTSFFYSSTIKSFLNAAICLLFLY